MAASPNLVHAVPMRVREGVEMLQPEEIDRAHYARFMTWIQSTGMPESELFSLNSAGVDLDTDAITRAAHRDNAHVATKRLMVWLTISDAMPVDALVGFDPMGQPATLAVPAAPFALAFPAAPFALAVPAAHFAPN